MSIQAVVFDIGGVLELTPSLGVVFLDDYGPCVEGARQAGIHAVLYQDNVQAIRDVERLLAR
jgi:FMN phosphatase YigB (HAD superfamily)